MADRGEEEVKLLPIGVAFAMLALPAPGQDGLPPWVLALSKIKRQAKPALERIPNYACLETVNRFQARTGQPFKPLDTLRVEVAFIDGKELFAPQGAGQFQDVDMSAIVSGGAFGTGAFTSLARNLFVNNAGLTTGWGEEELGGRKTLWYGYKIPEMSGAYKLQGPGGEAYVGQEGKFWVNAASLELLRIEDHAVNIPEYVKMREVVTAIVYNKVAIGPSMVLIPKTAETLVIAASGLQDRNVTEFTNCRQYSSESLIYFGPDDSAAKPPAAPKKK